VKQIEQLVRISRELGREVASAKRRARSSRSARYETVDQTLAELRYPSTRRPVHPGLAERMVAA
jgi:hypothetical protein